MNLKDMLARRRQNDYIKIVWICNIMGIIMCGVSIYHGLILYRAVNTPYEYIEDNLDNANVSLCIQNVKKQNDRIEYVSMQSECEMSVQGKYPDASVEPYSLNCYKLEKDYISKVYGIHNPKAGDIYMSKSMYNKLNAELELNNGMYISSDGELFHINESDKMNDEAAVVAGSKNELINEAVKLRIFAKSKAVDDKTIDSTIFLHIIYSLVIGVLCIAFAVILRIALKSYS